MAADLWTAISALATLTGSIFVSVTAIFAYFQLKEMAKARFALEMFHEPVIRYWIILEPYINHKRQKRQTKYQRFFEDLFYRSLDYREKHYPNREIK